MAGPDPAIHTYSVHRGLYYLKSRRLCPWPSVGLKKYLYIYLHHFCETNPIWLTDSAPSQESSENSSARMIGSRFADRIKARQRPDAGHMTAPSHKTLRQKFLATGEPSTHDAWLGKSRTVRAESSDGSYYLWMAASRVAMTAVGRSAKPQRRDAPSRTDLRARSRSR